jgi:hypothetical protein
MHPGFRTPQSLVLGAEDCSPLGTSTIPGLLRSVVDHLFLLVQNSLDRRYSSTCFLVPASTATSEARSPPRAVVTRFASGGFHLSGAGLTLQMCRSSSLPLGHTSTPIPRVSASAWVRRPGTVPHPFIPFRSLPSMVSLRAAPATQMHPGPSSSSAAARSAGPPVPVLTTAAYTCLCRRSTGEDLPSSPRGRSSTADAGSGQTWPGCTHQSRHQLEKLNRYV